MNKLLSIFGINFAILNMIDLYFTLKYFSAEINPLVINNPEFFYIYKFFSTWVILSISIYFYTQKRDRYLNNKNN